MYAISSAEFAAAIRACRIRGRIAVALSGGPDSVCLLFLVRRFLTEAKTFPKGASGDDILSDVVAITVDHGLQEASAATAREASELAVSLGAKHVSVVIPWGKHPFPGIPKVGSPVESIARLARYHLLSQAMQKEAIQTLLTGHHMDDQIETALMRLGRQSGEFGLAGMPQTRRWGMGDRISYRSGLGWSGTAGMQSYITRPLLSFTKDRILATCHANNLRHLTDLTNSDPTFTTRNALRYSIGKLDANSTTTTNPTILAALADNYEGLNVKNIPEALHRWTSVKIAGLLKAEEEANTWLERYQLPSPPSTVFISSCVPPPSNGAQLATVLRILRYVSPYPWGCASAQSHRKSSSLQNICTRVFRSASSLARKPFMAGSDVLWTPMNRRADGSLRKDEGKGPKGAVTGWMAHRAPPSSRSHLTYIVETDTPNSHRVKCINQPLRLLPVSTDEPSMNILFDCRFELRLIPSRFPAGLREKLAEDKARLLLSSSGRYYLPQLILRSDVAEDVSLWTLSETKQPHRALFSPGDPPWIFVNPARSMAAL